MLRPDLGMIVHRSELAERLVGHDLLVIDVSHVLAHQMVVAGDLAFCSSCLSERFIFSCSGLHPGAFLVEKTHPRNSAENSSLESTLP